MLEPYNYAVPGNFPQTSPIESRKLLTSSREKPEPGWMSYLDSEPYPTKYLSHEADDPQRIQNDLRTQVVRLLELMSELVGCLIIEKRPF